jgi:glyoxylase-like metal-dependent hydrolase (beta-lactamase superfamily II)/rhodanese-related sulfurtransferase
MYVQQLYTNCLAHAAYYIESGSEAAVIDPLRDPEPYIKLAKERGAFIKYVLETHFHADFVSGHIDLANKTGAQIVYGPNATPGYKAHVAEDGEKLPLGTAMLEILHTPGHTIESTCFLLRNDGGKPFAVFTGDTLFVGDVGRPDLLSGNLGKEELAAMLFDSLQKKIKTLPDDVIVYPGHGAGSACGKNIGSQSFSTVGEQKATNYAMLTNDRDTFISTVTSDLPVIPGYFFTDARINKTGYVSLDEVLQKSLRPLSIDEFNVFRKHGAVILDTRDPQDFAAGFIKGSLNIGLNGDFAVWVGTLLDANDNIILVTQAGKEKEAIERLARIGYENVQGYLDGGMNPWFSGKFDYGIVMTFTGEEVNQLMESEEYNLLDVRNRGEVAKNRMIGSLHIPLNALRDKYMELNKNKKWLVYCAGGYRSMIAASFLISRGFHFVASVEGGMKEIMQHAPELVEMDLDRSISE